jgi:hypothetical protein
VLLASIVPVRTEVMAGDFRLFNLAWLLAVQNREVEEVEVEPSVPSGPRSTDAHRVRETITRTPTAQAA